MKRKEVEPLMEHRLASKFCDSLGMSVILCCEKGSEQFRCLSSHLCGGVSCEEHPSQVQNHGSTAHTALK